MGELAYNLESFNPAFTAVLLKVQATIGHSDYVARDMALKNLIQPLAGEYGMHNGLAQGAPPNSSHCFFDGSSLPARAHGCDPGHCAYHLLLKWGHGFLQVSFKGTSCKGLACPASGRFLHW